MLINKEQIKDYVDFSDNIPDKKILPYIKDAELFDFKPIVPIEFYNALQSLVDLNIKQWSRTEAYYIGEKSYSPENQKKYIAIESTIGDEPSISTSDWSEIKLSELFDVYIVPYLVCCAFSRYLLWAGRNISQFGIRVNTEDSSSEVSDKARAELIADVENKKKHYWSVFLKKISDDNYIYDSVTYNFINNCNVSKNKKSFNIRAV